MGFLQVKNIETTSFTISAPFWRHQIKSNQIKSNQCFAQENSRVKKEIFDMYKLTKNKYAKTSDQATYLSFWFFCLCNVAQKKLPKSNFFASGMIDLLKEIYYLKEQK